MNSHHCPNCGKPVFLDDGDYCPYCGHRIAKSNEILNLVKLLKATMGAVVILAAVIFFIRRCSFTTVEISEKPSLSVTQDSNTMNAADMTNQTTLQNPSSSEGLDLKTIAPNQESTSTLPPPTRPKLQPTNTSLPPTTTPTPRQTNTPRPPTSTPTPRPTNTPRPPTATSTRKPTNTPSPPTPTPKPNFIASNRDSFSGNQGENGWKYLFETGRNSGVWQEMKFDGNCYRTNTWEHDVRICANGEVHPGQSTRIAYEWHPNFHGDITIKVHAHKIDTRCGDGIWIGTFRARDKQGIELKLGDFHIRGSDNKGKTQKYQTTIDPGNLIYVIIDIYRESTCDLSRVFIDIFPK